jgi:flagellar biosynthesis/type III secretory pathway protein FliH
MADGVVSGRVRHLFPPLSGAVMADDPDEDACAFFRPLFSGASASQSKSPKDEATHHEAEEQEVLCHAREKAFEGGYAAGKAEACRMVKASLDPELRDFFQRISDVSDYTAKTTTDSASHMVHLALAIAAHILGTEISISADELSHLQTHIQNTLSTAYRLTVHMHPQDRQELEQLIASEACEWSLPLAVDIQTDAQVPSGCLKACKQDGSGDQLAKTVCKKMTDLLGRAPA